ncbi:hypothetical protein CP8484711_0373B, partial [Chlamydia psittaci 84-8471/1]
AQIDSFC